MPDDEDLYDADCDMRPFEARVDPEEGVERRSPKEKLEWVKGLAGHLNRMKCKSTAGVQRPKHEWDKDGQCLYCPKRRR
jgi:hypothetical protein